MVSSQDLQWYASNCNAVIEERGMKLSDTYLFQIDLLAVPVDSLSLPSFPFIFPLCHFFHGFFDAFFFPFIVGLRILNYLSIQHTAFSIHLCFSISLFTAFHTSSLPGLHWKQLSFLFFFCLQHGTEASSSHYSKHYHSCPSIITCIFYGHPSTSSDLVARTDWPFTLVLASISLFCFFQRTRLLLTFAICPCTQSFCFSLSWGSGKFITKDLSQKVSSITKVVIKNRDVRYTS